MMLEILLAEAEIEKNEAVLAITDPHVHIAIAITVVGLVTPSLMCGAKATATIAAIGMMLKANNSDHTVGKKI